MLQSSGHQQPSTAISARCDGLGHDSGSWSTYQKREGGWISNQKEGRIEQDQTISQFVSWFKYIFRGLIKTTDNWLIYVKNKYVFELVCVAVSIQQQRIYIESFCTAVAVYCKIRQFLCQRPLQFEFAGGKEPTSRDSPGPGRLPASAVCSLQHDSADFPVTGCSDYYNITNNTIKRESQKSFGGLIRPRRSLCSIKSRPRLSL